MDGCYVWQEEKDGERLLLKGYLREESFAWQAVIVDNAGQERWSEKFASPSKARSALVQRVPEEARFVKGAPE